MPHLRKAFAVAGSRARRSSSTAVPAASVLVGVGSPAFLRQVAMAARREVSTLGVAGVPVAVTDADADAETEGVTDVDVIPPDDVPEQAATAGRTSAAVATTGTRARIGATVPPRLGTVGRGVPRYPAPMSRTSYRPRERPTISFMISVVPP
jgi:hypothetical protein